MNNGATPEAQRKLDVVDYNLISARQYPPRVAGAMHEAAVSMGRLGPSRNERQQCDYDDEEFTLGQAHEPV
jgi:hypothetical protein